MRVLDLSNLQPDESKLLDELAIQVKERYNEIVSIITDRLENQLDWLLSPLLSRNPYLSNFFHHMCLLSLANKLLVGRETYDSVITDSHSIFRTLKRQGYRVELKSSESKKGVRTYFKRFLLLLYSSLVFIMNKSSKRFKDLQYKRLTLIDIFFTPSMFDTGKFQDRYYPGMLDYLNESEKHNIFFVPEFYDIRKGISKRMKMAENSSYQFLYKFDFLRLEDYLYALTSAFRMRKGKRLIGDIDFEGFNLKEIIEESRLGSYFNHSQFLGLLNYRFVKRLDEAKVSLNLLIDWFENQPLDKGFQRGMHEFYPATKTKGYEGFIVSWLYNLYMVPTSHEKKNNLIPKEVNVVGSALIDFLKENDNTLLVKTAPAFRFQNTEANKIQSKGKDILIALPVGKDDVKNLITLALYLVSLSKFAGTNFHIKLHPINKISIIERMLIDAPPNLNVLDTSFNKALSEAFVLISAASTACLEAVLNGVPALIMANSKGITQNPIPLDYPATAWKVIYTKEEAATCLEAYQNENESFINARLKLGDKMRKLYFKEVDREGLLEFLDISK
jgi:hypothetical protein